MLGYVLDLDDMSVHHPGDLDWLRLPDRVAVQLHWPRTPYLRTLLEKAQFNVVTISRHPFDVLISILRMAQTEPETIGWLWGRGGDEEELLDADPSSEAFAQWAMSERALNLLEVTSSWLDGGQAAQVSYERLVAAPEQEVDRLLTRMSLTPVRAIGQAVRKFTPDWVNERSGIRHAWTATTGVWQEVIPSDLVDQLNARYSYQLRQLGFSDTPATDIDPKAARARWRELYPEPDPALPDEAYRAEVGVLDPPTTVPSLSSFSCLVKVHNRGPVRWPNRLRHPLIRLGCRWYPADGLETVSFEDRSILEGSIRPGATIYEQVIFATPPEPGDYLLQVDLVHEDHRWFGCEVSIEVTVT